MTRSASELFPIPLAIADAPPWARELYRWLARRGYAPYARTAVVGHAVRWGTVECCPELDQDDLDGAESFVPTDPEWQRRVWDMVRYSTRGIR